MLTLTGRQGKTVIVNGSAVKLIKKGGIFATQRDKTIPIRNIASVEVKKPGPLAAGFIQFGIAGAIARESSFTLTGGTFDAAQDENSVLFVDVASYNTALRIKEYIETFHEESPSTVQPPLNVLAQASRTNDPVLDQLERLGNLRAQGVLTEGEFQMQKTRLLGSSSAPSPLPPPEPFPAADPPPLQDAEDWIVSCPSCAKSLRVPMRLSGCRAKCPGCGHIFELPVAPQ